MKLETLGYALNTLGMLGFISESIYSIVLINTKKKLSTNDWGLQIFAPTIISLILFGIGSYLLLREDSINNGVNETLFML